MAPVPGGLAEAILAKLDEISRPTSSINVRLSPKEVADAAAAKKYGRPIILSPEDPLFMQGLVDAGLSYDNILSRLTTTRFPRTPINNPSRVPTKNLVDPNSPAVAQRTRSVAKGELASLRSRGIEPTSDSWLPPTTDEISGHFQTLQNETPDILDRFGIDPIWFRHGVVTHSPSRKSLVELRQQIGPSTRSAGGDIPNWAQSWTADAQFEAALQDAILARGRAKGSKAARELARALMYTTKRK